MINLESVVVDKSFIAYTYVDSEGGHHDFKENFYRGALNLSHVIKDTPFGVIIDFENEDDAFVVTMIDGKVMVNDFEHYYEVLFGKKIGTRILPKMQGVAIVVDDCDMILLDHFVKMTKFEPVQIWPYQKSLLECGVSRYRKVRGPVIHPLENKGLQYVN